jgi:oligosaccharide repeat unit polymerase
MIGFGRLLLFEIILYIIIVYALLIRGKSISEKEQKNRGKNKKQSIAFILFIFLGIITATITRMKSRIDSFYDLFFWLRYTLRQGIIYFLGSFRALDEFLSLKPSRVYGYTVLRSTVSGLEEIISNIFIILGIPLTTANEIMSSFTKPQIVIGSNGQMYNAFYTGVMNFYLDGGISFVVLIPFILGTIIALIWNRYCSRPTIFVFAFLVLFVKNSITYQYRWDYSIPSSWVLLALILFRYWRYRNILLCSNHCPEKVE